MGTSWLKESAPATADKALELFMMYGKLSATFNTYPKGSAVTNSDGGISTSMNLSHTIRVAFSTSAAQSTKMLCEVSDHRGEE